MTAEAPARPQVVPARNEALWFLGTFVRVKLDGAQTGGRFALLDFVGPHGAAPPLHSHPQDETFFVVEGEATVWLVEDPGPAGGDGPPPWVAEHAQRIGPGAVVFAPAGTPHTFRVESDTARIVMLSTPAGIEDYMRALGEPAAWPWLQPPPDGPRVAAERLAAVERELGIVRHGPPPPPG